MLFLISGGLGIPQVVHQFEARKTAAGALAGSIGYVAVAEQSPINDVLPRLASQLEHVAWTGCSLWDLIQPAFMFMVGVAIPYSYASRRAKGESPGRIFAHVLLRSLILILLGIFLSSNHEKETHVTFVNVLTQIGLGYTFVYLLRGKGAVAVLAQVLAIVGLLGGYWYLFYSFPPPKREFDYQKANVTEAERFADPHRQPWQKGTNFAADFDVTLLNLFRREKPIRLHFGDTEWVSYVFCRTDAKGNPDPFWYNPGGYTTLNFLPSMATMIFGLMAGELLRSGRQRITKLIWLILAGGLCLAIGLALDHGIDEWVCPIVKRIWTPSWAVFSAGWVFLGLAAFYLVIDVLGWRRWTFPLVVLGMNSIAVYCMSQLMRPWLKQTLQTHFGQDMFNWTYGPIVQAVAILALLWLICLWMYHNRIFIRI
jgi:predicted acyltransferase